MRYNRYREFAFLIKSSRISKQCLAIESGLKYGINFRSDRKNGIVWYEIVKTSPTQFSRDYPRLATTPSLLKFGNFVSYDETQSWGWASVIGDHCAWYI